MKKCLVFVLLILLVPVSEARYSYEGMPFEMDAQGTIQGNMYLSGGHGLGFPPYSQSFDVPGGSVLWARLYVGVWGGTENYEGWVQPGFNGLQLERLPLSGECDENDNVYCSGHGVYWVSYDVSSLAKAGENTVEILTSRGEPGNRLDGRVYGTVLAAALEDQKAPVISYQIYAGNVNLHGMSLSGSSVNVNDFAGVNFSPVPDPESIKDAELSVVYLSGSKGLPDYLEFNGERLGTPSQYLSNERYGGVATDIANEVSYDALGGSGSPGSYFDIEAFDVLEKLQAENRVTFLRGSDLDGNGEIDSWEGEDYVHPVLASLVLIRGTAGTPLPDLSPELAIREEALVDGEDAEIPFIIHNPGGLYNENCTVSFRVDGQEVSTAAFRMDARGVYSSSFTWPAEKGDHEFELAADPESKVKESDEGNNVCKYAAHVKSGPELSVSLGEPVKVKNGEGVSAVSAFFLFPFALLGVRRKKTRALLLLAVLVFGLFGGCVEQESETKQLTYLVPLSITNSGEASARDFSVNLYLDGESVTVMDIPELEGKASISEELHIKTEKGEHTLNLKVDESNRITESDEENNECEIFYNFT
ncbi:DUF3344 domain-containing protein [Methanosarcina sp. KYL-1]|uniref:CARDB domain-containing protein n=1 Tax=Methanosarcina sp. KYL-1 TaxID=2602068 RepID=UPI002101C100|nr:CARDB domain-containing protein [Methanosarcina sp. KYL-1]MCQ1535812.1 DUF3344 domain-containing protein [Methanosarcina sp. KYL-1]